MSSIITHKMSKVADGSAKHTCMCIECSVARK